MLKVIGVGDNVCDIYKNLNMMYPGGQALNFSVFAKLLECDSSYLGVFGKDNIGDHVQKVLNSLSIDISRCKEVSGENGYAIIELNNGDRKFVYSNRGGVLKENPIEVDDNLLNYLKDFDLIHTSNNSYFDDQLPILKNNTFSIISYDFSTIWEDKDRTKNICKNIDFAFLSCSELELTDVKNLLEELYNYGAKMVIGTRGSSETVVYDGVDFYYSYPEKIEVVDTLGAGDSFATSFLIKFITLIGTNWENLRCSNEYKKMINECLDYAKIKAGETCGHMGAFGYGKKIIRKVVL